MCAGKQREGGWEGEEDKMKMEREGKKRREDARWS